MHHLLGPVYRYRLRVRLHLHKIYIVPMETDCLSDRMGKEPILPVKWVVSIDTMINFDRDRDGDGDGNCKRAPIPAQPDTKTDTHKLTQKPIRICVDVCLCAV